MEELVFQLIVGGAVTALTYGIGPLILCKVRKRAVKLSHLRLFCFSYTFLIWLVWQFLTYDGTGVRTMPAILWGTIFYRLSKKSMENRPVYFTSTISTPNTPEHSYTCPKCGQTVQEGELCNCETSAQISEQEPVPSVDVKPSVDASKNKRQKRFFQITIIMCILLFGCSCFFAYKSYENYNIAISLTEENAELLERVQNLNTLLTDRVRQNRELKAEASKWESKYTETFDTYFEEHIFLNHKIGFIVSGSKYYHKYSCSTFQNADVYWAHNIEYCESLGYSECPRCWSDSTPHFSRIE